MAKPLVSDELWAMVEPLIPRVERRYRFPGRKRIEDRKVLSGILFVLQTGIPWEYLPQEMGCGSGMTCWRRLRECRRRVSGGGCTSCCSRGCIRPTGSTGRER
jgi:transposase